MPTDWKQSLDSIVNSLENELIDLRRHFHAHPEPSGAELETSLRLYQRLADAGLDVRMGPDGCGVVADNSAPAGVGRVAFRGDIDALLIQDAKRVSYRSVCEGVMHACGHDVHATIAVGVAVALRRLEQDGAAPWPLAWRAILQPAEETATGARQMIDAGVMEGVRAIFALHVDPTRLAGEIGLRAGAFTAQCDALRITVRGRGGHGARPHESKDPIAASAQLISTLYQFVPRVIDSHDAVVLSFGRVCGGQNANVIPEEVELEGTLRTLEATVRASTIDHIRRLSDGIEKITGTQIAVELLASIPAVVNDLAATRLVSETAAEVVGLTGVQPIARPSMGSEDFACFLEHCPGVMFRLGAAADLAAVTPLHTPQFDVDETAIAVGVRILARAVILACGSEGAGLGG
jgi:amidohydrolase